MGFVAWPEWVLRLAWQGNLELDEHGAFVLIKEEPWGQGAMPLPVVQSRPRERERVFKVKRHAA